MEKEPEEKLSQEADEIIEAEDIENNELAYQNQSESSNQAPVVIKKSGGFLTTLLALLALGLAVFNFYQQWREPAHQEPNVDLEEIKRQLQTLTQAAEANSSEVKKNKNAFSSVLKQANELADQVSQLQNQPVSVSENPAPIFDNSANETALQQLNKQLNQQKNLITQLQTELNKQPNNIAHEEGLLDETALQKSMAAKALMQAQMMVDVNNLDAAISGLERLVLTTGLEPKWTSKINRLINTLKNVNQPDLTNLRHQLNQLNLMVDDVELTTVKPETESKWYDRFVSIKKIDDDAQVVSTAALIELKSMIKRKLYEAQLFLNLQQQSGWELSLSEAQQLVDKNLPAQTALSNAITALSKSKVLAVVPNSFDTQAIIDELNGLR